MVKQLNVFSENRPGKLEQITGILADARVNILAMKLSSNEDYGVCQFILDDPEKGFHALKRAGVTASQKDVLAIGVEHEPGSMHDVLRILRQENVDIEDCYGFVMEREQQKKAIIVLVVADLAATLMLLDQHGLQLIGSSELYSL
jgi:hypothetical protein